MLDNEQKRRGKSERELAREFGWSQQAFNTWLKGGIPRPQFYFRLGEFLNIGQEDLLMLLDEARESTGNTRLPKADQIYGKVSDRKDGRYSFPLVDTVGGGRRFPLGRYAIRIDTKVMEPALLVGTKAWCDPATWPRVGHEVLVHSKGAAWIGRLISLEDSTATIERNIGPVTIRDVEAVHVIVLSERIPGGFVGSSA